ncbi:DNA polymerase epsilon subunit 4 [Anopheles marshallii]|uniref:DNA polymerase epsilon subunit 4 n=1 Tax=Anopheles marshallii TaxID=1521116 RepID=UPI00237A0AC7|nr:DNA polymerase epsilon subunit 4 [Anopheles marshallii]
MEEVQFSEELFSTQDEASFQNVDSLPDVVPEKSVEKDLVPVAQENASNNVAQEANASIEKDTPDLVFSEDIDFDKHCEEAIDASDKSSAVESTENAENIAQPEASHEAIESNVPQPMDENVSSTKAPEERLALFPFARIKQIMKLDPDVGIVSAEAIFVVTKAAELFLQTLAKDTSSHTLASKKKTMSKRDVELAIDNVDALMFLEGMMNV